MDKVRGYLSWLLKHPIAFAWILAFIAIALNWMVSGKSSHAPEANKAAHTQMATANSQPSPTQAPAAHSGQAAMQAHAPAPAADAQASAPVAQGAEAPATPAPEASTAQATDATQAPAAASVQAAGVAPEANVAPVDTVTNAVATTTVAANADADLISLLRAARQAYWDGVNTNNTAKLEEAAGLYEKLVAQDANPSHKGELANVFWKMENHEKAADLYIEIGPWLKEQNRTIELINMKVYVDITNPEKGKKLGALIGQ
ncbi:MAG: hypothetical protein WAQ53_16840 [Thiofilum sp.]|uniref:hypothetical protein n=1 Tax=Thiofilum sp. TaxID=2212733 RepID=UPI0025DF716A|nr:hypothetical protein [Thiofilum sp.]MBK8452514.1 hypothetical protein [Thiofilum sp.]